MMESGIIFEIIVFCLKVMSYTYDASVVDVVQDGQFMGSWEVIESEWSSEVSFIKKGGQKEPAFVINFVDNALYNVVEAGSEEKIVVDIAPYFMNMEWDNEGHPDQVIEDTSGGKITISNTPVNTYIYSETLNAMFIIPHKPPKPQPERDPYH